MPKIEYKSIKFQQKSLELIRLVNQVVEEYQAQGYELTLRQAYYQLVARGYIPNNERSYKNIGNLINDGRLAGLIDWHSITDRTRNLRSNSHWDNPADVIASARYSYLLNKWDGQPNYAEVWVEKDALVDIVGQACRPLDTPYFSCRGYTSQSEMWSAAQRFISQDYRDNRVIIHLGDHDPSGIDMTRDIQERLQMFGADVYVKRVALTMNQIGTYNPPPNPAKITDSRASKYIDEYGNESWELDALEPQVITDLITNEVTALRNDEIYRSICDLEERGKDELRMIERNYDKVCGDAKVWGNAEVFSASHVLVIGAIPSRNDFTTFYRDKDNEITVKCGCFLGKIDRFLEKVTQTHGDSKYALVYRAAVEVAKLQIDLSGEAPKDADEE